MNSNKTLFIDASRIRSGGGVLHLKKILKTTELFYFDKVVVFTNPQLKEKLENFNDRVILRTNLFLNKNVIASLIWQLLFLKNEIKNENSILLTLDSTTLCTFKKNIIINQDIIGFQKNSLNYFKGVDFIYNSLKCLVARRAIENSFGAIFTTDYAKSLFNKKILSKSIVIPHGVNSDIISKKNYSISHKKYFDIIYVSPVLPYKNHIYIIESLKEIANKFNLKIHFVGGGDSTIINKLKRKINKYSLNDHFIFHPFLKHDEVIKLITNSDIALFTSSVECFGITLLEYMRAAMPIICSNISSLPETLKDSGIYIDLNNTNDLKEAVELFYRDESLRKIYGRLAYENSLKYSWEYTSNKTIEFVINKYEEANMC